MECDRENKKALCISGGGLRAMSGAAALISAALATEYDTEHHPGISSSFSTMSFIHKMYYDDAIRTLMNSFSLVSTNSGGSWFAHAMLMSSTFDEVLREMTHGYMKGNTDSPGSENPFYRSFLAISLKNIDAWNEEVYDREDFSFFCKAKEKSRDKLREALPFIGGDLSLFLKQAVLYKGRDSLSIWKSLVEALMTPLSQNRELPPWYKKVALDWFINITLTLPKQGPLRTVDPSLNDRNDASETSFRKQGTILRSIRPDYTYLKYVTDSPNLPPLEPTYVGNYQKYDGDTFGRVDIVPAAFKVSSENSKGMEYNFTSPSLNNLSVKYYVADNNRQEPLSGNHIETTLVDPSFNFIRQKPLHFLQRSSENAETIPPLQRELDEILYRVVASSAAIGTKVNFNTDRLDRGPEEECEHEKEHDLPRLLQRFQHLFHDLSDEFDVSVLFGPLDAITSQYSNILGCRLPEAILEWELRGKALAEECDNFLGKGELLSYETSNSEKPWMKPRDYVGSLDLNLEPRQIKEPLSLRQFANLLPLNISDGGTTDNTGIGRAVMEGASHISCLSFYTDSFLGLFENNGLSSDFPNSVYFDIFNCTIEEMAFLKKVLNNEDLSDVFIGFINFTFVCRKTFRQAEGKDKLLKKLFMCKFRDLSVKANPYYFDSEATKNSTNKIVKEMSVIFAIQQRGFGIRNGSLDSDFTNYGTWAEEIHCALKNGFEEDHKVGGNTCDSVKDKISSARIFREFIF